MKNKTILFDFDGVIKESVSVKTDAFYKLYLPFGEDIAQKAKAHHILNGGMSRFEKFKHYHKVFLNIDLSEDEIDVWANKFAKIVRQSVIDSKYVKGAKEALFSLVKRYQLYIITGTPQQEMEYILKELGLTDLFIEICGSPKNKIEWSKYLIDKYNLIPQETVFIGDATSDYNAAITYNFHFVLREHFENIDIFKHKNINHRVNDLIALDQLIDRIL